jgi:hypothetical protein
MKTKAQKVAEAKKNAEKEKANRKLARDSKSKSTAVPANGKKGKSVIPQAKKSTK